MNASSICVLLFHACNDLLEDTLEERSAGESVYHQSGVDPRAIRLVM